MSTRLDVLKYYSKISLNHRIFLTARSFQTSYENIAHYFPDEGTVLDLGCGYGLLSFTLALQSRTRKIVGVDHDDERINIAKEASNAFGSRVEFRAESFEKTFSRGDHFCGIALIDSLHYSISSDQEATLKNIYKNLLPGGVFVMREVDLSNGIHAYVNRLHEWLATSVGFTKGKDGLFFRSELDWANLLKKIGFKIEKTERPSYLFADVVFVCRK